MAISLTQNAAKRVRQYLEKEGGVGLHLGVRKTGCSGWTYTVGLAHSVEPDEVVFEDQGIKIVVPSESLDFLNGSEIDFTADGLSHAFRFNNPNVAEECGCGESFTVN